MSPAESLRIPDADGQKKQIDLGSWARLIDDSGLAAAPGRANRFPPPASLRSGQVTSPVYDRFCCLSRHSGNKAERRRVSDSRHPYALPSPHPERKYLDPPSSLCLAPFGRDVLVRSKKSQPHGGPKLSFPIIAARRQPKFYKPRHRGAREYRSGCFGGRASPYGNSRLGRRFACPILGSLPRHSPGASPSVLGC